MKEELKPCPACGSMNLRIMQFIAGKRVSCYNCGLDGVMCDTSQEVSDAWNALPRALEWTKEPPQIAGFYLAEHKDSDGNKYINAIEVLPHNHWRHADWERKYGKLSCLLGINGFGVGPVSKYSRFAGPIPMPKEAPCPPVTRISPDQGEYTMKSQEIISIDTRITVRNEMQEAYHDTKDPEHGVAVIIFDLLEALTWAENELEKR